MVEDGHDLIHKKLISHTISFKNIYTFNLLNVSMNALNKWERDGFYDVSYNHGFLILYKFPTVYDIKYQFLKIQMSA